MLALSGGAVRDPMLMRLAILKARSDLIVGELNEMERRGELGNDRCLQLMRELSEVWAEYDSILVRQRLLRCASNF